MAQENPSVVILGGPNGAGKTTAAAELLRGVLAVDYFVNADTLAQGLSGFEPEQAAIAAGRIMIGRLRELAAERADFAFETTLASRSFVPWLSGLIEDGYVFHLVYLWLPSTELAAARVAARVNSGGHYVSPETVERRYHTGLKNFFRLYMPIAESWRFYDNSTSSGPKLVAEGAKYGAETVHDATVWRLVLKES